MDIILISINCSEFFSWVFSGQDSQLDCKEKEIKVYSHLLGKYSLWFSIDEIWVLNKIYYSDWGVWHMMICYMMGNVVLLISISEWAHAKAISLHAERFIPRILLFEDKVDWCLSLLPQLALQSTNSRANS